MSGAAGAGADYRPGLLCEKHDTVTQIQLTKEKKPRPWPGFFVLNLGASLQMK